MYDVGDGVYFSDNSLIVQDELLYAYGIITKVLMRDISDTLTPNRVFEITYGADKTTVVMYTNIFKTLEEAQEHGKKTAFYLVKEKYKWITKTTESINKIYDVIDKFESSQNS